MSKRKKGKVKEKQETTSKQQLPPQRTIIEKIIIILLALIAYLFIFGYVTLYPLLFASLVAALFLSLFVGNQKEAIYSSLSVGFLGALLSILFFTTEKYITHVNNMPAYVNRDTIGSLYTEYLFYLVQSNPLNSNYLNSPDRLIMVFLSLFLTTAFTCIAFYVLESVKNKDLTRLIIAYSVIFLVSLNFIFTAALTSDPFVNQISSEPPDYAYRYDGLIYLKTYYNMLKGTGYYKAYVSACSKDFRLKDVGAVKNGKFVTYVISPILFRQPYVFYFLKLIAPVNAKNFFFFSLLLCVFILFLSFNSFFPYLSFKALFIPLFSFPIFFMHSIWHNILFPDWWASLMVIISFLFLLKKNYYLAGVFAFLAAIFREVLVIWLLIMFVFAVVFYLRDREYKRVLIIFVALLLLFAITYSFHLSNARNYIGVEKNQDISSLAETWKSNVFRGLEHGFLTPTSYMMFPYGFFSFPPFLFLFLGAAGLFFGLKSDLFIRAIGSSYILFWTAYYLVLGVNSSYWGQHIMPFATIATAVFLLALPGWISRPRKKALKSKR